MEKKEFVKKLGTHLKELRKERGLTQAEIASLMGKDRQSYQRVELGTTNPTIGYLIEIAKALQIPFTDLFLFLNKK
ncbi:MAG: helix-turn-helix transcriptional regulator [Candidatus Pacebacteria bacterium]|nr:helix-turn-helix transcriptional regulator [Candidatus Paceibacterota bacterium]